MPKPLSGACRTCLMARAVSYGSRESSPNGRPSFCSGCSELLSFFGARTLSRRGYSVSTTSTSSTAAVTTSLRRMTSESRFMRRYLVRLCLSRKVRGGLWRGRRNSRGRVFKNQGSQVGEIYLSYQRFTKPKFRFKLS